MKGDGEALAKCQLREPTRLPSASLPNEFQQISVTLFRPRHKRGNM